MLWSFTNNSNKIVVVLREKYGITITFIHPDINFAKNNTIVIKILLQAKYYLLS